MRVVIRDYCRDDFYYLEIDESQLKMLQWLDDHDMLDNYDIKIMKEDIWEKVDA